MKKALFLNFFIIFLFSLPLVGVSAREEPEFEKFARLEGGLILGGQVVNDVLVYTPGVNLNYTYSIKTGNNSCFGIGAGFSNFKDESFIPVYFDFLGLTGKNRNNSYVNFQAGYAFGSSELYKVFQEYEFKGGICFGIGLGRRFKLNDKFSAVIDLSYRHQFASVRYSLNGTREVENNLNYDMLFMNFGIMLHQQ